MQDFKARLLHGLNTARNYTNELLSALSSESEWLHRATSGGNHALWIAGHLAVVDNAFIGRFDESRAWTDHDDWKTLFGKGSQPHDDAAAYPSVETIRETMAERRAVLLECLESCSDEDFRRELPPGAPPFLYDIASMFQMGAWHEGIHAGQLSIIHRQLGHPPLR
ncbi:DinB family protein [bacterium]|nr:DinB family protein [bacterium]